MCGIINFCRIIILLLVMLLVPSTSSATSATLDESIETARQHTATLKNSEVINDKLFQPALSDQAEFSTFDGITRFHANIACGGEAPIIRVTAFPVGSLSAIGELNLRIEYDRDLDGTLEDGFVVNNIGGICANGIIKDCSPSGSWKNCRYCRWASEGGLLREQCEYGGAGGTATPIGPQGMLGCFCINASCGAPVLSMMEQILSFVANGILNELKKTNNTLVISKTDYKPENMQLSYLGARVTNCSQIGNDNTISGLTELLGKFDFPTGDAIKKIEDDPTHPYNVIAQNFGEDGSTYHRCTVEANVGVEVKEVEHSTKLDFGIGVDADGGSKQCYWFRGGYCGSVFGETGNLNVCIGRIVPAGLSDICNQMVVNSGFFTRITNVTDYHATSGLGNYIGCYGSENDWADQLWEMTCWGMRLVDYYSCRSSSMSLPGQIIKNNPYNAALFQGCSEVQEPTNSCNALEKRRLKGECQLQSELVDGVYVIRNGAVTGLEPAQSCKTITGSYSSIYICEPWWKRERIYRCKGEEPDFNKIKERSQYIGDTINYDFEQNIWRQQGDLTWNGEDKSVRVYDPNLEFMATGENCLPGCRLRKATKVTDLFVPGQGKLASDGGYHMDSDGQLSKSVNRDTVIEYIKECEQQATSWHCPVEDGETMITGCQCFDQDSFGEVVGALQTINLAGTDLICSSGEEVGVCTPENQGIQPHRVMCGDFSSADGEIDLEGSMLYDCQPKLWQGTEVGAQDHRIEVNNFYECLASVPGYFEDDHFDNNLGPLKPIAAWFDASVQEASAHIIDVLKTDPRFIPDPGPDCPCSGKVVLPGSSGEVTTQNGATTCSWMVETSVDNMTREDRLELRPLDQDHPFGDVFLTFSRVGSWGGSTVGTCSQVPAPEESTTTAKDCVWLRNREDCSQGEWTSYAKAFDVRPQGSGTASYYAGSVPLTGSDRGIDLHIWYKEHDHLGTVQLRVYSEGCPDGAFVPGTAWSFSLPDGHTAETTRDGAVPVQCLKGSSLQVYVHSEGGRDYSGRHLWVDQLTYRSLACSQTAEYGCLAQTEAMPASCVVDGTITNCNQSGLVGPQVTELDNIIAPITRQLPLYSHMLPTGVRNLSVRTDMDALCIRGKAVLEFQTDACPGWRQAHTVDITCDYHDDLGGGTHVCPISGNFQVPDMCLSGKLQLRLTMAGARADSRCMGRLRSAVQYEYVACSTEPRYVCEDQAACSAACGITRKYQCANGLVVNDPALCPRWVCSRRPGTFFQSEADCTSACAEPVACNAQSDSFQAKVTIRNQENSYISVLDMVTPVSVHIASWAYPHEDRILQQCVDRYTQPLAFTDPATGGKFEFSPIDALIYQWSAERGEAARDASSGIPDSLPKYPPVYRPQTADGKSSVPNRPMYWAKSLSATWVNDDSLRLGYSILHVQKLTPYVYYYQCPTGVITSSHSNTCGAILPFGGVDWTISGMTCFQYRCDPETIIEPNNHYGGCGMVSDGKWQ